MKRISACLIYVLVFTLLVGCSNASNYIKESYSLVNVEGKGKTTAKVYSAEGKDVPTTAKEIAANEKPSEISKDSPDQMFLVYKDKIVNVHKDPNNEANSLVEVDTVEYAKEHYDSSFLEGYVTATLLQSIFGNGWGDRRSQTDYRGYNPPASSTTTPGKATTPTTKQPSTTAPSTTDRKGSFGSTPSTGGSKTTTPPASSSNTRKSDGSTPSYKAPSTSKPSTSPKSGSFTKRK